MASSSANTPVQEPRIFVVPNAIVFEEALALLAEGRDVTLPFAGISMKPTLQQGDKIVLSPLARPVQRYDVVLYRSGDRYLLHRVLAVRRHCLIVRGDACRNKEKLSPHAPLAIVSHIVHVDGNVEHCENASWRRRSRRVVWYNALYQTVQRFLSASARRRLAPWYFLVLAILMWAPLNGLGVSLNNFVFGIRLDHLLHASVYLCCSWFLMDCKLLRKGWQVWLVACLVGAVTESVQYLLPYRGFNINDFVANIIGVSLGWLVVRFWRRRCTRSAF